MKLVRPTWLVEPKKKKLHAKSDNGPAVFLSFKSMSFARLPVRTVTYQAKRAQSSDRKTETVSLVTLRVLPSCISGRRGEQERKRPEEKWKDRYLRNCFYFLVDTLVDYLLAQWVVNIAQNLPHLHRRGWLPAAAFRLHLQHPVPVLPSPSHNLQPFFTNNAASFYMALRNCNKIYKDHIFSFLFLPI